MYHSALTNVPSVNLDYWMMGEAGIRNTFSHWMKNANIAVIEGMGALFDGASGTNEGSAVHIAAILGVPVVAVIDVYGMTRTTAAIIDGLTSFDPDVNIAGFILNRYGSTGSTYHADLIKNALGEERWSRVLSVLSYDTGVEVAERHLGLVTTHENDTLSDDSGLMRVAAQIDVDKILNAAHMPCGFSALSPAVRKTSQPSARLAVARDAAFCFYYEENLAALMVAGFEIAEFSPLAGELLPEETDAVYFGGGYPESFACKLSANVALAEQLRSAAKAGMPIYGECGGLIYLGRSLTGFDGTTENMSGVLPIDFIMDSHHLQIRYVELTTCADSFFGKAGITVRGQEFHQSRVLNSELEADFYSAINSDGISFSDGYQLGNVMASYTHLYFASCPDAISNFVEAAKKWKREST
jgi:cobyrinic acid a,c-diamide synthase